MINNANLDKYMDLVNRELREFGRLFIVSFYGIAPDVVVVKNGFALMIIYHCTT